MKNSTDLISIVVPCFNEEEAIPIFYDEITRVRDEMKTKYDVEFEYVFVNDGSTDATLDVLRKLHSLDNKVRFVSFSRNFGKEAGIYAGLKNAKGDYVVTMDVDLQDPPALLPRMYEIVSGRNDINAENDEMTSCANSANETSCELTCSANSTGKEACKTMGDANSVNETCYGLTRSARSIGKANLETTCTSNVSVANQHYDCVATRRSTRKGEPPVRSFFARKFYKTINKLSDTEIVDGARDYRFMTRKMTDAVLSMAEYNRFSKGIFSWVGFRTKWIEYENIERCAGETKWNFWSLLRYSVEGIVGFSTVPLLISVGIGILFCFLAFAGIIFVIIRALVFGDPTSGWPSMVCIILLCSGVQLFCTGILGEYLAKTYLETKHRPMYIVAETEEECDDKQDDKLF